MGHTVLQKKLRNRWSKNLQTRAASPLLQQKVLIVQMVVPLEGCLVQQSLTKHHLPENIDVDTLIRLIFAKSK